MQIRTMAAAVAFVLGVVSAGFSQETTGALRGRVFDAQGLPVPGVTVTVTGPEGAKIAVADSDGRFNFPFLTPGTYSVRAELDNSRGRLRPEMFGKIRHVEGTTRLPVVPVGAVIQREGSPLVYREVTRGVFEPVTVTLGERVGERVAIRSGLQTGARVVTDGVMLLQSK